MVEELRRWSGLNAFKRMPKGLARNVLDSMWVLTWKIIDGQRQIKARLTVRGYRDMQAPDLK
eukprot:12858117-Heterocapsa_arctica.AAC.1